MPASARAFFVQESAGGGLSYKAKKEGEPARSPSPEKLKKLDAAMDAIRKKYGKNAIHKGELTDFSDR